MVPYIKTNLVVNSAFTHDLMNLTVDTSYLSWSPPPTRRPAFEELIAYFTIIFLLILFLLLRHCLARRYLGRQQLAASPVLGMESVCCICEGETLHHLHDVNTMLRAHCIANQFNEYWLDNRLPAMKVAELIIRQCRDLLEKRNDVFQNMCIQFPESGDVSGYRLFKLSQNEFEDRTRWEKLISVFAFSTKLINRENSDLISKWLMHVLLQKQ